MFRADTNAGESEDLIKKEYFTGHDFEKQFALIFNDRVPDYGLFGQIAVSRKNDENDLMQELFSFNLVKVCGRFIHKFLLAAFQTSAVSILLDAHM